MRTLLCKDGSGKEFRVSIPDDSIITFGPSIAAPKESRFAQEREYALRIYKAPKNEANMIAVFTGVREFREQNVVTVDKLVIREGGKSVWNSDEHGFSVETKVKRDRQFVSEDKLLETSLNDDEEMPNGYSE